MADTDIGRIVGHYITLTPTVNGYKALCPFHQEQTPSFHVNTAKGFWHCFGCGASGDVVKFVERKHGIPYEEAATLVACIRRGHEIVAGVGEGE